MLIVVFVFLVYIGVWYIYMNNFMETVNKEIDVLETDAYADELQHKVNLMCEGTGKVYASFKQSVTISCGHKTIKIMESERTTNCDVTCQSMNASTVEISKPLLIVTISKVK